MRRRVTPVCPAISRRDPAMRGIEGWRRAAPIVLVALWATPSLGCAPIGPTYARPAVPTPPAHRFVQDPAQAASLADLPWWQVFEDPALQALVREAVSNNLDLRQATARVEEMRARAGIVKSFLYPNVDGTASYTVRQATRTSEQDGVETQDDTTHQSGIFGFQLSWELDLFGRIRRQHEAALALVLATEQGRRGVIVTLVGDVASGYFLLRQLDVQLG